MSTSHNANERIMVEPSRPGDTDFGQDVMNSIQALSQPVEMTDLSPSRQADVTVANDNVATEDRTINAEASQPEQAGPGQDQDGQDTSAAQASVISEADSAIQPASDQPAPIQSPSTTGSQLVIILLLHSTQTRHPYIINERYLKKRNVSISDGDPTTMRVYTLKELIWREWREEWESRPASPSSIRLIHMGRMLDDKAILKDNRFTTGETPHVVHMSLKPQDAIDDEDARIAKSVGRDRDNHERSPGCRCCLM